MSQQAKTERSSDGKVLGACNVRPRAFEDRRGAI
jgi:hypothetical protein